MWKTGVFHRNSLNRICSNLQKCSETAKNKQMRDADINMKNKKIIFAAAMTCALLFAGCGNNNEVPTVVVDSGEAVISYSLVTASIDDVTCTQKIDCSSVESKREEVSFSITGKYVDKVYVREGQSVKKGDLLCELSSASLEEAIENLSYYIKRNELVLSHLEMDRELDIQEAWINLGPYMSNEAVGERVKSIQESYARQILLVQDNLEFDREELAAKQKELRLSRLYASMDGMVYKLDKQLEGSTSKDGKVIMNIIDNSEVLFKARGIEYKDMFKEGDTVKMVVSYSTAAGEYLLTPYDIENWTENMIFSVYTGPDNATVEVGTMGMIYAVADSRSQVLTIPKDVLHQAGDKSYVYTLSEDNNREIRYVEVGLIGDEKVEILSGLTDGEKVVKK